MHGVRWPTRIPTAQEPTRRLISTCFARQVFSLSLLLVIEVGAWTGLCGRVFEAFVQQQLEDAAQDDSDDEASDDHHPTGLRCCAG